MEHQDISSNDDVLQNSWFDEETLNVVEEIVTDCQHGGFKTVSAHAGTIAMQCTAVTVVQTDNSAFDYI